MCGDKEKLVENDGYTPKGSTWLAAVDAQEDDVAEARVANLTAADEPMLLVLLQEKDANRQWWAIRALGACGSEASLGALLPFLETDHDELRAVAIMALGNVGQRHPTALQPFLAQLTACLADASGMIRQIAADTLAQCGNPVIPALVDVLRYGKDQGARSRAAYALAKIGTLEAAPALYRCLNDPNYLVHTYAYEALEKMGLLENVLLAP